MDACFAALSFPFVILSEAKDLNKCLFCMFLLCRFCFALRSALAVTGARTFASEQNKTCVKHIC